MTNLSDLQTPSSQTGRAGREMSGQTLLETAIAVTLLVLLLLGAVQVSIIANAASAVTQLAYAGARYASVNPSYSADAIVSYMKSIAPASIAENGGTNLNITVSPATAPRTYGAPISITIVYTLKDRLFLPTDFFGIKFPMSLAPIQETVMSE